MIRSTYRGAPVAASLLGLAALSQPALAQEAAARPTQAEQTFAADYFRSFNPVTAEDMVRRIPGFTLDDGEERRGFAGASGNVLINGERPSSKAPISEQLSRISSAEVERIDLYSGNAEGAAVTGQTLFVDVRLRPRSSKATNTFVLQASQLDPSDSINPLVVLSSSFRAASVDWTLALQAQPSRRGRIEYDERITDAANNLIETSDEQLQGHYWEYKMSARGAFRPTARDAVSFNAQVTPSKDGRHTFSEAYDPAGALLRIEDSNVEGDNAWAYELGGDWERRFSPTSSFKLIGLASQSSVGSAEQYRSFFIQNQSPDRTTLISRGAESGEYIGRAVWSFQPAQKHQVELGGELAFNYLDSELDVQVQTLGLVLDRTPPVANTRVEEQRGEIFIADTWRISDSLRLESGLTVETSTISQSGDAVQERDFTYAKPRINAVWSASPSDEFRLLIERDVAQLDFSEFATSINNFDGTTSLGNPNLEPERTWRAQAEWQRRFAGKGVFIATLFHDEVDAVQDQIPIFTPTGNFDGPGNLGDGTRTGVRLSTTLPLDAVGLAGGELRLNGTAQETEVTDPTTGQTRRFSDEPDWTYSIDYQQPIPSLKLRVGALYEDADEVQLFRYSELRTTGFLDPHLDFFVETTAIRPFIIRFTVSDVLLPADRRERRFFTPDRTNPANLSTIETRDAYGAYGTRSYAIRVSGRF